MKGDIFLACHINAFRFFGGVPQNIVYDNLKSVVVSPWERTSVLIL